MKIQWNGAEPTRVRLNVNEEKVEVQPGETFEVDDADYARFLLNYHRKVMVEIPEDREDADTSDSDKDGRDTKEASSRVKKVVTAKQRKTKAA